MMFLQCLFEWIEIKLKIKLVSNGESLSGYTRGNPCTLHLKTPHPSYHKKLRLRPNPPSSPQHQFLLPPPRIHIKTFNKIESPGNVCLSTIVTLYNWWKINHEDWLIHSHLCSTNNSAKPY